MSPTPPKRRKTSSDSVNEFANFDTSIEDVVYAGRVVSLQMVNFMCHSNLEITFNPRVNFISGRNGSGKSAVMAALVVVLGGSATNTQRGTALSDFIRKGENSGRVSIELLNEGLNAYKPDEFGNRIFITRTFSRSGGNSYIVKSAHGEVISKKKQEVDKIAEVLRLEVTNPICVLNQDVARSFLTSSDSKLRYELFMRATQLKQLKALHAGTVVELTESLTDLERKSALLDAAKKEVEEIRKKLAYLRTLEKVSEERRDLENEFLWAGVVAEEEALRSINGERESIERKLKNIIDGDQNSDGKMNELLEELNELKNDLNEVMNKKRHVADEKRIVHEEVLKSTREITRFESQLELSLPKLHRVLGDIKRVKEFMEEIDERNNRSAADYARVMERTRIAQAELKSMEECYVATERDMNNAEETKIRTGEKLRSIDNLIKDLLRNKEHKTNQLEGLKGQGDMDALKYGAYVPRLLNEIDNAVAQKRFIRKPIGPLGIHVKLNCDPKWGPAVESIIGPLMTAFCCDNDKDFRVLLNIMDKVVGKKQPSVIISKFQSHRHNVHSHRINVPGFLSILDAISVDDDTAFNTIVDQAGIEGILLFERDDQAAAMLTHIENVPKNLRMAVTMGCDKYYPAPNYRTYAGRPSGRYFNQSNRKEDVIGKLENAIKNIVTEMDEHVKEQRCFREELRKMDDFANKTKSRLRELREKRDKLKLELSQLKDQEDLRPVPRTRLALEEELETLEQQRETYESERNAKQEEICKIKTVAQTAKEKLEKFNKELDEIQQEIIIQEEKISANTESQNALKFMKKNYEERVNKLKQQLLSNQERKIVVENDLRHRINEAQDICPTRVDTNRSLKEISKLLEKKEQYLKAAEKISGSKEEAMTEFREKKEAYEEKINEQNVIRDNIAFFTRSVHYRIDLFNEKRQLCAQEISYYFRGSLLTRGYDGMLQFNFEDEQLELEVHPHRNESGDRRTDAKTLSGGERSYSTVSFILAMWRAVVMPFYFLDEFDVFMDKVNRKVVMDLLLTYANEKTNTQFVFITPQDISSITASETISVFKMPDPERNSSHN